MSPSFEVRARRCSRPQQSLFADKLMTIVVVYEGILSYCSPLTLVRLSRVCHATHAAVQDYMHIAYSCNINHRLRHFFSDPLAFRSLQARTGTVITGSFALQFFDRSEVPKTGLDIIVHMRHRREVGRWLIGAGYCFRPAPHQDPDFEITIFNTISLTAGGLIALDGIASVMTFQRTSAPNETRTVKLIVAGNAPMEVVLSSHSTCAMNVISYESAYCLFPRATLEERLTLLSSSSKGIYRNRGEALAKYVERGFNVILTIPANSRQFSGPCSAFPLGWRWIDDDISWVVSLDMSGVNLPRPLNSQSSPVEHDPSSITNWHMRYNQTKGAVMHFSLVSSDLLGYSYLIGDQDLLAYLPRYLANCLQAEKDRLGHNAVAWALFDSDLPRVCREFIRAMGHRRMSCMRT
ncbi:hypothetical protein C8T65DRAFT_573015 [Cerioporus squamosus]|nr:hypothetical protein C8T65DRAFT_573015 [Cerioporus squamosus]